MRVGERLVGVRTDTHDTAERVRSRFADWLEPETTTDSGEPMPCAFGLRLDADPSAARRPRPVPQLRIGSTLLARSRNGDEVLASFDHLLGGVLARQDDSYRWLGLRVFVAGERAVLVDAARPLLMADRTLDGSGVRELAAWSVAVDGVIVRVPPPLTAVGGDSVTDDAGWTSFTLVGLVGVDRCDNDGDDDAARRHRAEHHPTTPAGLLARFARRHPSLAWFDTLRGFVDDGNVVLATDRASAVGSLVGLLTETSTS